MKNNTDDLRRIARWVCDRAGRHDAVDRLTLYREDGKAASVELSPACAISLVSRLLAAAAPRLS
jgi:hypothetical protein